MLLLSPEKSDGNKEYSILDITLLNISFKLNRNSIFNTVLVITNIYYNYQQRRILQLIIITYRLRLILWRIRNDGRSFPW